MQSKLAQVMFTIDLAQELAGSGITVNCLHPATYMATTMVREAGVSPTSTVEEGADAILNLVVSPALEGRSGLYFNRQQETRAHAQAYDATARQRLARAEPPPDRRAIGEQSQALCVDLPAVVMPGLVPAIHAIREHRRKRHDGSR